MIVSTTLPRAAPSALEADAPPLWFIVLIFWGIFAVSVVATGFLTPLSFIGQDPDNLMRLVMVRDLVAGQNWFDLVQHRMDPPHGSLMHWSRLIDAPIAGFVALGNLFGVDERFALTAWPLLLLLAFMAGATATASALGGRRAAVPTLILALLSFDPLLSFFPGDIDHHNAQLALLVIALALALRSRASPMFALAAGGVSALMLAIGLEMLPYVACIGGVVALRWALAEESGEAAASFGVAFAISSAALYVGTASSEARFACDSLSLAYVLPATTAGFGLAVLALFLRVRGTAVLRLAGLVALSASTAITFFLVAPGCLGGPYGALSSELKALWLETIVEALPLPAYFMREPVGTIATLGPPLVALIVVLRRLSLRQWKLRDWALPLLVLAVALVLSFYQVRTIRYANAVAIPVLGVWIADLAFRHAILGLRPLGRALPLVGAFLLSLQFTHLGFGWAAVEAVSFVSAGRIAPRERAESPAAASLTDMEKKCLDPASAALLASVTPGIVLAPVFYGPAVLALSEHTVIAGPYHRSGEAILDTIHAMRSPPETARAILEARGVDLVAICATSREAEVTVAKAPDGLLARLLNGSGPAWLAPVASEGGTMLRLWRVRG